jgi:hypothetical protein
MLKTLAMFLTLAVASAWCQGTIPAKPIHFVITDPTGSCGNSYMTVNITTGGLTTCKAGTWAAAGGSSAATAGNGFFYLDDTNIVPTLAGQNTQQVNTLLTSPNTAVATVFDTATGVVSTTVAGEAYLFNTALAVTKIPAANWIDNIYAYASSTSGSRHSFVTMGHYAAVPYSVQDASTITVSGAGVNSRTVMASAGTPFATCVADITNAPNSTTASAVLTPKGLYQVTACTDSAHVTIYVPTGYTNEVAVGFSFVVQLFSTTTAEISQVGAPAALISTTSTQSAFTVTPLTKLLQWAFFVNTGSASVNITYTHNGTQYYSNAQTPFAPGGGSLAGDASGPASATIVTWPTLAILPPATTAAASGWTYRVIEWTGAAYPGLCPVSGYSGGGGAYKAQCVTRDGTSWEAVQVGSPCQTGTIGYATIAALGATTNGEITIVAATPGTQRYQGVVISETTQFVGTSVTSLTVSMGRAGSTNHAEMTNGINFPLMASSGDVNYISTRPMPPQITSSYGIVLNLIEVGGTGLNALTAGSLTWEVCSYAAR